MLAMSVLVTAGATSLLTFQTEGQTSKVQSDIEQRRIETEKRFPTVRYDKPEEQDPQKRAKRRLASARYDNAGALVVSWLPIAEDEVWALQTEAFVSLPAIPIKESELIVIGKVLDAYAHLSNNKKTVYSEFTIHIDEVLKDTNGNIKQDSSITVDREGGFVEYINGLKRLHFIGGWMTPQVGKKYILFLKNPEKSPNYAIINGYELKDGGVIYLTGSPESISFLGMDQAVLLSKVRKALSESPTQK